jgi:predicted HTH domain antitoxin
MGTVTTVRFDEDLLKKADELAKIQRVDRSTILRKATELGLKELLLQHALDVYRRGLVSVWKAAELADVPLWRFIDVLKEREIGFKTSEEDLREMIEAYL